MLVLDGVLALAPSTLENLLLIHRSWRIVSVLQTDHFYTCTLDSCSSRRERIMVSWYVSNA